MRIVSLVNRPTGEIGEPDGIRIDLDTTQKIGSKERFKISKLGISKGFFHEQS